MISLKKILYVSVVLAMLIPGALAADVTTLDPGTGTDWNLWIISGLLGLILFLASLRVATGSADVEIDAIISVLAWIPIGYCAYGSFHVNRYIAPGIITIYSQAPVGMLMFAFLMLAIGNTLRLVVLHRAFKGEDTGEREQ